MKMHRESHPFHPSRWPDVAARAILIGFLAVGFWYSLWNPLGEGVDEGAHFQYVRYIREHRSLPIQPYGDNGRPILVYMGHHPPLYYVLGALVIAGIDVGDTPEVLIPNPHFVWGVDHPRNGWNVYIHTPREDWPWRGTVLAMHLLRGMTLLMGAAALWAVYRIGRLLVPSMPWLAVTGMAVLAFNPSFVFMSSAIHHDALMAALYAGGMWWLLRRFERPPSSWAGMVGGLLLGAALLTKLSGLALALLFGMGFLLLGVRRKNILSVLPQAAVTYGVALLVSGWWYLRNWILYGDPLGWEMYKSIFWFNIRSGPFTWHVFTHEFLYQLAQTFWGAFGFMHITLPPTLWWGFWKGTAVLVALGLLAMAWLRRPFFGEGRWALWLVAAGGLTVLFVAFVRHATETAGVGHARFLFPGIAVMLMTMAIGAHAVTAFRLQPLISAGVTLGMLAYALWVPPRFVIPLYPRPETATAEEVASARPVNACFADMICIRATALTPESAAGAYRLTLYWQAQPGNRPDLYAHLRLCGEDPTAILEEEFWPMPYFSTVAWDPNQIYRTRRSLQIPPGTPAGTYSLVLSLSVPSSGETLPAQGAQECAEHFALLTRLTLEEPIPYTVSPEIPRTDELEHGIRLLGYLLEKRVYHPGETLDLTLFWQPRQTVQPNLVVFVHVLDPAGNLVAQHDGVPDEGRQPTPFWQPGKVVSDLHPVPLPSDLPAGTYTLSVGMYDWPGLQRLQIVDGPAAGEDHIPLETIRVEP